eukprot:Opistho-2@76038
MNAISAVDEMVREYLLFRGFTSALRAFDAEAKVDREKGFQAEKIVDHIFSFITAYDIVGLKDFWGHLDQRFFSRLDNSYANSIRKLDVCLHRYYIVYAIQNGRHDKVLEFFDKFGADFHSQPDWRDWFVVPFVKSPELMPTFETFFSKQWLETFTLSLSNFLSTVFQGLPPPTLLSFNADRMRRRALEEEIDMLRSAARSKKSDADIPDMPDKTPKPGRRLGPDMISPRREVKATNFWEIMGGRDLRDESRDEYVATARDEARVSSPVTVRKSNATNNLGVGGGGQAQQARDQQPREQSTAFHGMPATYELQDFVPTFSRDRGQRQPQQVIADPLTAGPDIVVEEESAFNILTQDSYEEHRSRITHCRFSAEGNLVASVDADKTVKLWSLNPTPTTVASYTCPADVLSIEWETKTDRTLFVGLNNSCIKMYSTESKRLMGEILTDPEFPRVVELAYGSQVSLVSSAASAARMDEGALFVWNVRTNKLECTLPVHNSRTNSLCFSQNGKTLVAGGSDGMIRLFDMTMQNLFMGWQAHDGEVHSVQFSPDGNSIYSYGSDGKFVRWTQQRLGARLSEINIPSYPPSLSMAPQAGRFAFDASGEYILMGSPVNHGVIYEVNKPAPLIFLSGQSRPVVCVDWTPRYNACVTGSLDGTIRITKLIRAD